MQTNSKLTSNVSKMRNLLNATMKWVQMLILNQLNLKKRTKTIKLCISVAMHMKDHHLNFSGFCAILNALISKPITSLRKCWSKLGKSDSKKFEKMQQIFNNDELLSKLHSKTFAPSILHLDAKFYRSIAVYSTNEKIKLTKML
eukprot:52039_1